MKGIIIADDLYFRSGVFTAAWQQILHGFRDVPHLLGLVQLFISAAAAASPPLVYNSRIAIPGIAHNVTGAQQNLPPNTPVQ